MLQCTNMTAFMMKCSKRRKKVMPEFYLEKMTKRSIPENVCCLSYLCMLGITMID